MKFLTAETQRQNHWENFTGHLPCPTLARPLSSFPVSFLLSFLLSFLVVGNLAESTKLLEEILYARKYFP